MVLPAAIPRAPMQWPAVKNLRLLTLVAVQPPAKRTTEENGGVFEVTSVPPVMSCVAVATLDSAAVSTPDQPGDWSPHAVAAKPAIARKSSRLRVNWFPMYDIPFT